MAQGAAARAYVCTEVLRARVGVLGKTVVVGLFLAAALFRPKG